MRLCCVGSFPWRLIWLEVIALTHPRTTSGLLSPCLPRLVARYLGGKDKVVLEHRSSKSKGSSLGTGGSPPTGSISGSELEFTSFICYGGQDFSRLIDSVWALDFTQTPSYFSCCKTYVFKRILETFHYVKEKKYYVIKSHLRGSRYHLLLCSCFSGAELSPTSLMMGRVLGPRLKCWTETQHFE